MYLYDFKELKNTLGIIKIINLKSRKKNILFSSSSKFLKTSSAKLCSFIAGAAHI